MNAGIEQVLQRAQRDAAFREALLSRRSDAVIEAGIVLTPAERAMLDAVTESQLEAMIASVPREPRAVPMDPIGAHSPIKGIRPALPVAVAAGAVLAGGVAFTICLTAGVRPDVPALPAPPPPSTDRDADVASGASTHRTDGGPDDRSDHGDR